MFREVPTSSASFTRLLLKTASLIYIVPFLSWLCQFLIMFLLPVLLPEYLQTCKSDSLVVSVGLCTLIDVTGVERKVHFFRGTLDAASHLHMCSLWTLWWPPYPFLFAWLWNPSWFFSSPKHLQDFLELGCLLHKFSSAHWREEEVLEAGKGSLPQPHCLSVVGWVNKAAVGSLILLQFRAVHTRLLVKVCWHGNLSVLFWDACHYPNGLYSIVMGKKLMVSMSVSLVYFKTS